MKAQLVADIGSLNVIHDRIKVLMLQIAETIVRNEYKLVDRNWWILGLKLIQRMKRVGSINVQKKDILDKIKKLISALTDIKE